MSEAKRLAGEKAIEFVEDGMIVGVGTGSTVAYFIDALGGIKDLRTLARVFRATGTGGLGSEVGSGFRGA